MISSSEFECPNCRKASKHRIIFLGSEFSYQCLHCESTHCFLENLYWEFTDNFLQHGCGEYKWKLSRCIGTRTKEGNWIEKEDLIHTENQKDVTYLLSKSLQKTFDIFVESMNENFDLMEIETIKVSDKNHYDSCFVANAISTYHFQDCFRAVVRMKEHLEQPESKKSYNILICDNKMSICISPISKLQGIDEIWIVPSWSRKSSWWHVKDHPDDYKESAVLSRSINKKLDSITCESNAISKSCSPTVFGNDLIKNLLHVEDIDLFSLNKEKLDLKYIVILVRKYDQERAAFASSNQLDEVCKFVRNFGFTPLILATSQDEEKICGELKNSERILRADELEKQVALYKYHCYGVIGTNCSGCNIPCLYELPLLTFAKIRPFPDDFYCMGRLASPYDCSVAFNGPLSKPKTVTEIKTILDKPTSITNHMEEAEEWIRGVSKRLLSCE
jgi:hypothetical protein